MAAVFIASKVLVTTEAEAKKKREIVEEAVRKLVPIATSDNNVYVHGGPTRQEMMK